MIGIQLGMLPGNNFDEAAEIFRRLQARFSIPACEVHLERTLYPPALWPWEKASLDKVKELRSSVARLGIHLPFMDMNPISTNPRIAEASLNILEDSLLFAAQAKADYAVFHARGRQVENASRAKELQAWSEVLVRLGRQAATQGLVFCLENADDLWNPGEIRTLLSENSIKLCLDLGHLFERRYPTSLMTRMAYALNDRISPYPFALKKGLPVEFANAWHQVLHSFESEIACIHLHNHNGRVAHRRLRHGKIDLRLPRDYGGRWRDLPVILEVDYSHATIGQIEDDLRHAGELLP